MASNYLLTKDQWAAKIRGFVPPWFFEDELLQEAFVYGIAAALEQIQIDCGEHLNETFIGQAVGGFLDAHGAERTLPRLTDEFDAQYRVRIVSLANQSNCPALKVLVDQLLIVGESTFLEDYNAGLFCDRGAFCNRNELIIDPAYNTFSIIVPRQIHDPYSFLNREHFADRDDYVGMGESSQYVFDLILEAVNNAKACGVQYRVIELTE